MESVHHLLNESWPRLEGVGFSPSLVVSLWEGRHRNGFWSGPFSVSLSDYHK